MASLGHCQNILSARFAFVGTGIAPQGISSVGTGSVTWTHGLRIADRLARAFAQIGSGARLPLQGVTCLDTEDLPAGTAARPVKW